MTNCGDGERIKQETAVLADGLVFRYGNLNALDKLDLTIPRGVSFGLLGPNGTVTTPRW